MKMSKSKYDQRSLARRIDVLEKQADRMLREIESLEARVERLERLPHNMPRDILTY